MRTEEEVKKVRDIWKEQEDKCGDRVPSYDIMGHYADGFLSGLMWVLEEIELDESSSNWEVKENE